MKPSLKLTAISLCLLCSCIPAGAVEKPAAPPAKPSPYRKMPPVKLDAKDRAILTSAHPDKPMTAVDYYLALPASYFSIVENSPERRVSLIDKESLSDSYLSAAHWFEGDAGGFSVTIRLFPYEESPLIAITTSRKQPIFLLEKKESGPGQLQSVMVEKPQFWTYRDGKWITVKDVLPTLPLQDVLDLYRHTHRAHLDHPDQRKFIALNYTLPKKGEIMEVTGRENFMDPSVNYVWATYRFDGKKFQRLDKQDVPDF